MPRTYIPQPPRITEYPDSGCEYGGPSCLSCRLPRCFYDMDGWEFKSFNFKGRCISDPTDADGLMFKMIANETAVAIV